MHKEKSKALKFIDSSPSHAKWQIVRVIIPSSNINASSIMPHNADYLSVRHGLPDCPTTTAARNRSGTLNLKLTPAFRPQLLATHSHGLVGRLLFHSNLRQMR